MKNIEIIGGGTISHVRNHLALCAPAYGTTAKQLHRLCELRTDGDYKTNCYLTNMAGGALGLETNEDVGMLVDKLIHNPDTKIIFFNPALVDFNGAVTTSGPIGCEWSNDITTKSGKYEERLKTSKGEQSMLLWPSEKIIGRIRKERKDIFLVAFKTTCGATEDEQFLTGLHLLKSNSCNLVLANDTKERRNMIITPEQARYCVTNDRELALRTLVDMAFCRAAGHFTRSNVIPGFSVPWDMETIPHSLKAVVEHCIAKGAYKPFKGSTVGHFAFKKNETDFITSKRRTDFNQLEKFGMVLCRATSDNEVIAFGTKPSVGGQSQRIVFKDHPEMDCIVHFHCPIRRHSDPKVAEICQHDIPVRSQYAHECGSHECGKNTSDGLREVTPGIKCVFLDNHGPNIVFNHRTNPADVIAFIDRNFDLSKSTDQMDRSQVQVS
jgi:hypothetical protein